MIEPSGRWKRVTAAFTGSAMAKGIGAICTLIQVPLALSYLGAESFGLWILLQTAAGLILLLDGGTGYALQNAAASRLATGHTAAARLSCIEVLRFQSRIALAACVVWCAAVLMSGGMPFALGRTDSADTTPWLLPGLVAIQLLALPTNLAPRVAHARQQAWWSGLTSACVSVLVLAALLLALTLQLPAAVFLTVAAMLPVIINGLALIWLLRASAWGGSAAEPSEAATEAPSWRSLAVFFFLPFASSVVRQQAPAVMITALLGPAALAPYGVAQRLFGFLALPLSWTCEPLWPAWSDAFARRDYQWAARAREWALLAAAATVALLILAGLYGPMLLSHWTGESRALFPSELLLLMAVAHAGAALTLPLTLWLNADNRPHGQAIYATATAILLCVLLPFSLRTWGLAGAPLAEIAVLGTVFLPGLGFDLWAAAQRRVKGTFHG